MQNISILTLLVLTLSVILCSCGDLPQDKWIRNKEQAIQDARAAEETIHLDYLQCYALSYHEKNNCLGKLIPKYVRSQFVEESSYTAHFQYESEKLGFVNFINQHGLSCDAIKDGPVMVPDTETYLAKCANGDIYLFRFHYDQKKWLLIK